MHVVKIFTKYRKVASTSRSNDISSYRKVANSSPSRLVARFQTFRRLMKGKFDAYVMWPLAKNSQNWIVDQSTARYFTEIYLIFFGMIKILPTHLCWVWITKIFESCPKIIYPFFTGITWSRTGQILRPRIRSGSLTR